MKLTFYFCRCTCVKASCITNRCACFKAGRKCNSRCHPKNANCRNHDNDLQAFAVDDNPYLEEEDGNVDEEDDYEDEELGEDEEMDDQVSKKQKTN